MSNTYENPKIFKPADGSKIIDLVKIDGVYQAKEPSIIESVKNSFFKKTSARQP